MIHNDRRAGLHDLPGSQVAREEFGEFFRAHHRELAQLAYAMTGSSADADEIAGEGLARAWENWERIRSTDHPVAFVRKIVMNLSVDRIRLAIRDRRRTALIAPMINFLHQGPDVTAALDLHAAITSLPPGRRACVVLRHLLGLPPEEVALTLGIRVGTVKSQTAKGLAQLRTMLGEPAPGSPSGLSTAIAENGRRTDGRGQHER